MPKNPKSRSADKSSRQTRARTTIAPLIILVNDDGIRSPGLMALARVMLGVGELLIVAPQTQQTSMGRALSGSGRMAAVDYRLEGHRLAAYAVSGTPALAVRNALFILAKRPPALLISGINYGENIGNGLTISGTVGAAIEAAAAGVPALAVSQATLPRFHKSYSDSIDFRAAAHFARRFALRILQDGLPSGAELINVNVPEGASRRTPWRWTRPGRVSYYRSVLRDGKRGEFLGGDEITVNPATLERDSDIRAVAIDRVVSASPLTFDLAARVRAQDLARWA